MLFPGYIGGAGADHPQPPGTGCHPLPMVAVPPVSLSLPWWHLAVILCPRCPCLQCAFPRCGGTWSPPVLWLLCAGAEAAPPPQPVWVTLGCPWCVLPRPRAVPQWLGPLACGGHGQAGLWGHWCQDRAGGSWCPCPISTALAACQTGPCTRGVPGVPHRGLCLCSCWGRSARSQGWHCPGIQWV